MRAARLDTSGFVRLLRSRGNRLYQIIQVFDRGHRRFRSSLSGREVLDLAGVEDAHVHMITSLDDPLKVYWEIIERAIDQERVLVPCVLGLDAAIKER